METTEIQHKSGKDKVIGSKIPEDPPTPICLIKNARNNSTTKPKGEVCLAQRSVSAKMRFHLSCFTGKKAAFRSKYSV